MSEQETDKHPVVRQYGDPKDFLLSVMNDESSPTDIRIEAAGALMPYFHVELNQDESD